MPHPSNAAGGRLGVLIPTWNCQPLLPRQTAAMSQWLDVVDEVVVVDSSSTDGTVEWLQANLRHPNLKIVNRPRGLYQAWNFGLSVMTSQWVLIATAGDVMEREGILHLLEVAGEFDADIVLSPPKFTAEDGSPRAGGDWPIHQVLRETGRAQPFVPSQTDMLRWTFEAGGALCGMLGSSASNLYRTRLLQACPFPLDASTSGDVAWGLRFMAQARRVAITPRLCAEFICHDKAGPSVPLLRAPMLDAAIAGAGLTAAQVDAHLPRLRAEMAEVEKHQTALRRLRARFGKAWNLWPPAWRHRSLRNRHRRTLKAMAPLLGSACAPPAWPAHFLLFMRTFLDHI